MKMIHDLKIAPLFFKAVLSGEKKAELRWNDRNFNCGDFLLLREWEGKYTGLKTLVKITHVLPVDKFIISGGNWVMMSIAPLNSYDAQLLREASFGGAQ